MNIDHLNHIFKPQVDSGVEQLQFLLVDSANYPTIHLAACHHPVSDIDGLLPTLESFEYAGIVKTTPKFVK